MKTLAILLGLAVISSGSVWPQADSAALPQKEGHGAPTLSATTNTPGVHAVLDSADLGALPLERKNIPEGVHLLRFVHPDAASWFRPAILETLNVRPGEDFRREVYFRPICRITSDPGGAAVRSGDSLLGSTPLYLEVAPGRGFLTLLAGGYEPSEIKMPDSGGEVYCPLKPLPGGQEKVQPLFLPDVEGKSPIPVYLAAGATVVTGLGAAYFKIKADGYYNDYQLTGDSETLNRVHKLDVFSGISLAASQLSLMALSYLLLFRQ